MSKKERIGGLKMIKIYGMDICPDCVACKASFDANGIEYDFRDIGKSTRELGVFIKIRDLNDVFEPLKWTGKIGIPAIVKEDKSVVLDWEGFFTEQGLSVVQNGQTCSIDGQGC